MRPLAGGSDGGGAAGPFVAAVETLVIAALFAAAGAWPVPDVNEAVYLTKARHAADPAWGHGDFFLETPDAHGVFYVLMGPLAAAVPLETAAWIGRVLGWLALAAGFRHAVVPLVAGGWTRLAAAAFFSLALRNTTAAGEWVIGGCEAKVFAWAAVLAAIGEIGRGRFALAFGMSGIATAVHPLVGGWAAVATVAAWLASGRPVPARGRGAAAVAVVVGLVGAAAGVVPALGLTAGVDAPLRAEAVRIYVVERLSHHLLPRTFADGMLARHVLAIAVWWLVQRLVPATPARGRIMAFTLAAIGIEVAGFAIALVEPWAPAAVHGLLRYYWFRLADVVVPFALATTVTAALADDALCGRLVSVRPFMLRALISLVIAVDLAVQSGHWPLPGRTAPAPRSDAKLAAAAAWADVCDWVRANAPPEACFLTPRGAASFTWRTGRREVVSWKNSPQDAASLVEWRKRIVDCFSRTGGIIEMERSTVSLGAARLRAVAERYGADHLIAPVDAPFIDDVPGERLYANDAYAVYRLSADRAAR
jgi:hypothetical protein